MSKYTDIIERLEKANGPNPQLDYEIAFFEGWTRYTDEDDPVFVGKVSTWWAEPDETDWSTSAHPPFYTASLDAAVALVERMLPDAEIELIFRQDREQPQWYAGVGEDLCDVPNCFNGLPAQQAPIALLIALFRALQAQDSDT